MSTPEPTIEERLTALEKEVADLGDKYEDAVRRYLIAEKRFEGMATKQARSERTDNEMARLPREDRKERAGAPVKRDKPEPEVREIIGVMHGTLPALVGGEVKKDRGPRDNR